MSHAWGNKPHWCMHPSLSSQGQRVRMCWPPVPTAPARTGASAESRKITRASPACAPRAGKVWGASPAPLPLSGGKCREGTGASWLGSSFGLNPCPSPVPHSSENIRTSLGVGLVVRLGTWECVPPPCHLLCDLLTRPLCAPACAFPAGVITQDTPSHGCLDA